MTPHMADDEVLRILDAHIKEKGEYAKVAEDPTEAEIYAADADELSELRAAVAALQAERDALRAEVEQAREYVAEADRRVSTMMRGSQEDHALRWQAESALEALRGQVAGLVDKWRKRVPADATDSTRVVMREWCADQLDELLAIKERKA